MSTDLTTAEAAELANLDELEAQATAAARRTLADERIQVPMLSIVQGTTKNPPPNARPGDFVNTVTGAVFGTSIEFLVAHFNRGRFLSVKNEETGKRDAYAAGPEPIVPSYWPDKYAGKVFADLPDAEETYAQLANDGQIEWGSGPPIQTTYNFTGIIIPESDDEDDVAAAEIPVRLSLKSTSAKAGRKAITLIKAQRNPWAKSLLISTQRKEGNEGAYFVAQVDEYGAAPDDTSRRKAVELALAAEQLGLQAVGDHEGNVPAGEQRHANPAATEGSGPGF